MNLLRQLPVLSVLEWIDVPILALAKDGSIAFANWAFADMIGYTPDMVRRLTYRQIFGPLPVGASPVAAMAANAELVIRLAHLDGSVVRAKVSEAYPIGDVEVSLTTFEDMTEQLWLEEQ